MKRALEIFNLLGVVVLAALCAFQWRVNRETNLELRRVQELQSEQSAKLAKQQKAIEGHLADLETFREQLTSTKSSETNLRNQLAKTERVNLQLTAERDQLKTSVAKWSAAIDERDEQLKIAATNIQTLIASRDEAVRKHNELARVHNQLVAERQSPPPAAQ